jgi:hypothetical protein
MKIKSIFFIFLLIGILPVASFTQTLPLVYNIENTGTDWPVPAMPLFSELPAIQSLPDPFLWSDGRGRISNFSDWRFRRAEINAQIQNYEIGKKPVRPDTITASYSGGVLTVIVTVNGKKLTLTSQVILPSGSGPFPAVIGMNSPSGSIPSSIFSSRNIAQITFNHDQVTTYANSFTGSSPSLSDPYFKLYPAFNLDNTGQYSAWAWGVSRIIDGLELVQSVLPIDLKHLAVTGCSYAGKMALFSGALDERVALTIAQESGGGGATSWRYSNTETNGTVEGLQQTDHNWFMEAMFQFGSNVSKLPEDHHELMAMCAPRALLVTANPDYLWLSNPSCYVCSKACQQVYNALGISDRFGFSIIGGHSHCAVPTNQIPEIEAFVEKFLLGNTAANTNIATTPYNISLTQWITWSSPSLSNNIGFYGWTSLVYPANQQANLDTNITLRWNLVTGAEKYLIQISTNQTFASIDKSDSTISDTSKTITGLSKGKKYYWRVQTKSSAGLGPWSSVSSFSTFIGLPAIPQLENVTPYQSRQGWYTFTWRKAKDADQYSIQVAESPDFTYIFSSASVADTFRVLWGFSEGPKYFWRIQAINLAGSSAWSPVSSFNTIPAPTNLTLQKSALTQITLSWDDNSSSENGYVIERKKSPQASFTILDTLKGSGNKYADNKIEQGQTYTYRVKAYNDLGESDYSNEASLITTDIKKNEEIPTEYSISQNYPNPFNPMTEIKYQVPVVSNIVIKVYDTYGKEVATLVNGNRQPGTYQVSFDGSKLASGVYFYRLQTKNFTDTKKLVIVK